jgi:hypothetical protein
MCDPGDIDGVSLQTRHHARYQLQIAADEALFRRLPSAKRYSYKLGSLPRLLLPLKRVDQFEWWGLRRCPSGVLRAL